MRYLIVSAAGNGATDFLFNWTDTGWDSELARQLLRKLGADEGQARALMQTARETACALVPVLEELEAAQALAR
jgi:hypothetical protein